LAVIKSFTNCFWVADFRDPWSQNPWSNLRSNPFISNKFDRFFEAIVVRKANKIICVTEEMAISLKNGFDKEEFDLIKNYKRKNYKFTLTHLGSFYARRSLLPFLKGIGEFVVEGKIISQDLLVRFVGNKDVVSESTIEMITKTGLSKVVNLTEAVPRKQALIYLADSDVLLLAQADAKLQIPVKFYEYLATGKPIIALTSKGATENIVLRTGSGYAIDPENIEELKATILMLYEKWKSGSPLQNNCSNPHNYERKELTGRFATFLEEVLKSRE
jgi:glycosyltransferase involved in cell wall biosynthesis